MLFKQPSDKSLAGLLNITVEEFNHLKHTPLTEDKNVLGVVIGYFMHISPDNDPELRRKIIIVKSNFIWFSVNQVAGIMQT